jgi:Suppressor of fused protein (SUFU)
MEKAAAPLIQHLELLFGRIQAGFSLPQDVTPTPGVQYAKYQEGTVPNVAVISTVGLSRFELESSKSDKTIRQELFMMFRDGEAPKNASAVLHQVVSARLHHKAAVLHGEVLRGEGPVFPDTNFVGLFATLPVYYPDEMWVCNVNDADVILCWLLPITDQERRFISQYGSSEFEALLDQTRFDLFDLNRPSVA